jgi:hypothetical protein
MNNDKTAPIALFTYNRPQHTKLTVNALANNFLAPESKLIIFSDGPKNPDDEQNVRETREYLKTVTGFRSVEIVEQKHNLGLAKSIIEGVTKIVDRYGKIIVVEDDVVTSPYFLQYTNRSLEMYEQDEKAVCIHGYVPPVKTKLPDTFFLRGADCWGWATWKRGWKLFNPDAEQLLDKINAAGLAKHFNFDNTFRYTRMLKQQAEGKIDSWAIRWHASVFVEGGLTLYPKQSLVVNIGFDGSGTHCTPQQAERTKLSQKPVEQQKIEVAENKQAYRIFVKYYRYRNAVNKLKTFLRKNR